MEDTFVIERVTDLMGDCNAVNPATYCDINNLFGLFLFMIV